MNWVNIEGTHVNADLIQTFFWEENELIVRILDCVTASSGNPFAELLRYFTSINTK